MSFTKELSYLNYSAGKFLLSKEVETRLYIHIITTYSTTEEKSVREKEKRQEISVFDEHEQNKNRGTDRQTYRQT